jgi:hypothetical protein
VILLLCEHQSRKKKREDFMNDKKNIARHQPSKQRDKVSPAPESDFDSEPTQYPCDNYFDPRYYTRHVGSVSLANAPVLG